MSEFVNYHKRDVQLPLGCKDLVDVLNLQAPAEALSKVLLFSGGLTEVSENVVRLLNSPRVCNGLLIRTEKGTLCLLYRNGQDSLELQIRVPWNEPERVKAVREVFVSWGFGANKDYLSQGLYHFHYQLPRIAEHVSGLVIRLLKIAYSAGNQTRIRFIFTPR